MNYQLEEQAFYSRLEADPLCDCAIALWHALRIISMVAGRAEGLSIPQGVLCAKAGTSPSGLKRARDQLTSKGLITWKPRGKEKATIYSLVSVCQYGTHSGTENATHSATHSGIHSEPLLYTTTNKDMVDGIRDQYGTHSGTENATHPEPFLTDDEADQLASDLNGVLNEAERIGMPQAQSDYDKANALVAEYSAEWVKEALYRTGLRESKARNWRFVEGILRKWREKGSMDSREKPKETAPSKIKFANLG